MLHEETVTNQVLRPTYVTVDLDILAENYMIFLFIGKLFSR